MWSISAHNAETLFLKTLEKVKHGKLEAPRGLHTLEIPEPVSLTLENVNRNLITNPYRRLNYTFGLVEVLWIFRGSDTVADLLPYNKNMLKFSDDGIHLSGAYGPSFVGQLPYVLDKLYHDRNSRQAIITIWNENPVPSKDIPCTVMMHFMIRDNLLNLVVYMRSNDAWLGFPYDIHTFTTLQKYVASLFGIECGTYTHVVGSMHCYTTQLADVEWALKYPGSTVELPQMMNGDLRALSTYEFALRANPLIGDAKSQTPFFDMHVKLLEAYWKKKQGLKHEFPEPYKSLREAADEVRSKFKDSSDTRGSGTDDADSRHGG